jgi:Asp/Glu/hydantoin racemase
MRILFLNQAPRSPKGGSEGVGYNVDKVEKQLNSYASAGTKVEVGFPDDYAGSKAADAIGKQSMLNGLHHMMETPAIVRKIVWAAENGYDAVIQSNTFDPGVDGGRLAVKIPVIGLFRTAIHTATMLADQIGITVPLASHVPYVRRMLRAHGLSDYVVGVKPIGIYGEDIPDHKEEIFDITTNLIKGLVNDGAEMIVPLGGALIPYVVDPVDLQKATGAPVLNTKAIGINFAELCVKMKMIQSPLTYPAAAMKYADFGESMFKK